jgi:excisionase family DNA binding protein
MRDDWVTVRQAEERVHRSRRTIYQWVQDGKIRTMRPMRALWLNVEDLLRVEAETRPGRPRRGA